MIRIYAGVGSRKTPEDVCTRMTHLAELYAGSHFILRSGGAEGADKAFEKGTEKYPHPYRQIFRPDHVTGEHIQHASRFHPAWGACTGAAQRLHARNSMIILGHDLNSPVEFVLYWHPKNKPGGTGQALRVAEFYQIPTFDLGVLTEWGNPYCSSDIP